MGKQYPFTAYNGWFVRLIHFYAFLLLGRSCRVRWLKIQYVKEHMQFGVRIAAFRVGLHRWHGQWTKRKHLQAWCLFRLVAALCTRVAQTAVCHVFSVSRRHRQVSALWLLSGCKDTTKKGVCQEHLKKSKLFFGVDYRNSSKKCGYLKKSTFFKADGLFVPG